jgi:hypothetical protein
MRPDPPEREPVTPRVEVLARRDGTTVVTVEGDAQLVRVEITPARPPATDVEAAAPCAGLKAHEHGRSFE